MTDNFNLFIAGFFSGLGLLLALVIAKFGQALINWLARKFETGYEFSIFGTRGPKGDTGYTGPAGMTGPRGNQGPCGNDGESTPCSVCNPPELPRVALNVEPQHPSEPCMYAQISSTNKNYRCMTHLCDSAVADPAGCLIHQAYATDIDRSMQRSDPAHGWRHAGTPCNLVPVANMIGATYCTTHKVCVYTADKKICAIREEYLEDPRNK